MPGYIEYPTETTYWIAYDTIPDEFVSYGKTTPEQSTITGRLYFWITLDELEWKDKLLVDFGVIVTDPEKIIQPESNPPI